MPSHKSYAIIDFETTGLSSSDRVIEIGVVLLNEHLQVEKTWDTLVNPRREIPNSFVHKITDADVVQAPAFDEIARTVTSLLAGRTMVAHDASFEHRFLCQEFSRLGVVWPAYSDWIIDTRELCKEFLGITKLHEALEAAGIINFRPHSALSDAMSTAKLLQWLAQQDSDIAFNSGRLSIYPSGLPNPHAALSRSSGIDADEQRWLLRLVKTLPRFNNAPLQNYRDILCEAIADREIDDAEFSRLQTAARDEEIQDSDISSLHREVIRQLTLETLLHSVNFAEDLPQLEKIAAQLNVDGQVIDELVIPASAPHGFRLNTGDHVAFSGAMEIPREEWVHRASLAGLVVDQVSEKTKVLVASNLDSDNPKAQTARRLNIPMVTESEFARSLGAQIDIDSSLDFNASFKTTDIEHLQLQRVFPWFEGSAGQIHTPTHVAQTWIDNYSELALQDISPFLDADSTVDVDRECTRVKSEIEDNFANLLNLSVKEIAHCSDLGKIGLNSIVISAVFAALDTSESAGTKSPAAELLEAGSLAGSVNTSDHDVGSATYPNLPFEAEELDEGLQEQFDAYAAKILDEKSRRLSLGMGWISLNNDLIPTAGTISLPSTVSEHFQEVAQFFQAYPPLLMVFEEATREVINAAKGDKRKLVIIAERWIGDATLDDLGNKFGVTRDRVRQLEVELREDFNQARDFYDAVLAKIERFIGRAIRLSTLEERFPFLMDRAEPFYTTYGKLFTAIDGGWVVRNGWVFSPTFEEDISQLLEDEKNEYGVALKHNVIAKSGVSERLLDEYIVRELGQKVISIKDYLIVDAGSHNSRAVALLSIHGEPMTPEEMQAQLGSMNLRSARGRYATDERLIRISGDQWALRSWGIPEFSSIADWISEQVDEEAAMAAQNGVEPQGVSLEYLLSQAGRLRVNENSIRTYATSEGLELKDGRVRRCKSGLGTPIGSSIDQSQNVYFRQGQWHLLLTLNKEHVRGSGFHIPRGIGNHYGLNFGDGIDLTSPHGTVRMGTDKLRILRLSSIRRFIENLGADVGDRVWLTFGDDRSLAVSLAPKFQPELTGLAGLYNHIGLDITEPELRSLLQQEVNDADTRRGDLLAPINEALGLSPDAPRRRTVSLLRQRNQDDLADAISAL